MEHEIFRLNLLAPLYYYPEKAGAFDPGEKNGEWLFCFELDERQRGRFEPEGNMFFVNPVFSGKAAGKNWGNEKKAAAPFTLPPGHYLFVQKREILGRESCETLAAELQQEGLWQRLTPGKNLYLRRLFEDGKPVTQLLRSFTADQPERYAQ